MPLTSLPRIAGKVRGKSFCLAPDRIFQSTGLTLAAAASISTKLLLSAGSGTFSSYFRFSGPPYSYKRTAFKVFLHGGARSGSHWSFYSRGPHASVFQSHLE